MVFGFLGALGGGGPATAQSVAARLRTVAPPLDLDAPANVPARGPGPKPPTAEAAKHAPAIATAPAPTLAVKTPAGAALPKTAGTAATPGAPTSAGPAARTTPTVSVKGLTGTLNTDDVHQTMEAQQRAFNACIEHGRRSMRWVSGAMRFAFNVDAAGRVLDARPVESSIGHRELEQCLIEAVSVVVFPKPAGRASAEFAWTVNVVPVGTPAEPLDPKRIAKLVRKQRRSIARECELRPRERFQLTAYVGPSGKVLAAGGFAVRARGVEKVDCVVQAVGAIRLPKVPRRSKVSFRL
jgi:outer membrane biosynthesis protein TonB